MKISVIIPSYKPQGYIWECLDSLYNQTLAKDKYEVILVLNGCCEPYKSKINEWIGVHVDLNINFIQTDQGGVSNARNIALDVVRGKFVTFIDDDDYISESYLELLLKKADEKKVILSDVYAFNDGNRNRTPYRISNVYDNLSRNGVQHFVKAWKYFAGPCYKLIPMSVIDKRRYNPSFAIGEDTLFMFQISDKIKYIDFSEPLALYYRRIRNGSAMTQKRDRKKIIFNEIRLLISMIKIYIPSFWRYNFRFLILNVLSVFHGILKA